MHIYTIDNFKGHYPVGTSAVVYAQDRKQAKQLLIEELEKVGLTSSFDDWKDWKFEELVKVSPHGLFNPEYVPGGKGPMLLQPFAKIINDGNY